MSSYREPSSTSGRNSWSVLAEEVHPSTVAVRPQRRDKHGFALRRGSWTAKLRSVRQQHIGAGQNHQSRVEKSELSDGRPIGELSDVIGPVGEAGRVYAEEVFGKRLRVSLRVTPLESEPYRSLKLDHLADFNHEVSLPVSRANQLQQTNSTPDLRVMSPTGSPRQGWNRRCARPSLARHFAGGRRCIL